MKLETLKSDLVNILGWLFSIYKTFAMRFLKTFLFDNINDL